MNGKPDYLGECMSGSANVPIDQFQMGWCRVCANRQCARSALNGAVFDRRVGSWKATLFDQVPRAGENDPSTAGIRAKLFLPVSADRAGSGYVPSFVTSPVQRPEPAASPAPPEKAPPEAEKAVPEAEKTEPALQAPVQEGEPERPVPAPRQPVQPMGNTPFQQGTVLPGAPGAQKAGDVVIEPGGTFTFGSDDDG